MLRSLIMFDSCLLIPFDITSNVNKNQKIDPVKQFINREFGEHLKCITKCKCHQSQYYFDRRHLPFT